MNRGRISAALRRQVRERAREHCEYCLLAEVQAFFPHEPDHIISQQHGVETFLTALKYNAKHKHLNFPPSYLKNLHGLTVDMRLRNMCLCHI